MIARLTTWLFYAVVFFLLGVWVGGFSPGVRALLRQGAQQAEMGGERIYAWANSTIGKTSPPPAPVEASEPPPQSAAPAAPVVSSPAASPEASLDSARSAFARGDVSQSISLYRDLVTQSPDDVDARGELGNVLLSAGRLQEAAGAYYETAVRLARSGEGARARSLVPVVRRNDPALADKLEAELKTLDASRKQGAAARRSRGATA
jgi:tetratricopeptide (TPR) repeat protein